MTTRYVIDTNVFLGLMGRSGICENIARCIELISGICEDLRLCRDVELVLDIVHFNRELIQHISDLEESIMCDIMLRIFFEAKRRKLKLRKQIKSKIKIVKIPRGRVNKYADKYKELDNIDIRVLLTAKYYNATLITCDLSLAEAARKNKIKVMVP